MLSYDQIRLQIAEHLDTAAHAQSCSDRTEDLVGRLGIDHCHEIEDMLPPRRVCTGSGTKFVKVFAAFDFWDCWLDAAGHDFWDWGETWPKRDDWPDLARSIASDLRANREISCKKLRSSDLGIRWR